MHKSGGFTIIELTVVVTVIGILATVTIFAVRGLDVSARDRERESDATSIARQLEIIYNNQTLGSPTYPGTSSLSAANNAEIFGGKQPDVVKAPNGSAFSLVAAGSTSPATTAGITPRPLATTYVYQPLKLDGTQCASGCSKFNLYYLKESTNTVQMIRSLKQQ